MDTFDEMKTEARVNDLAETVRDHGVILERFNEVAEQVKGIHTALLGTFEKKGLITTLKECEDYIKLQRKNRIDWVRWGERTAIAGAFAWVIAKLKGA